MGLPKSGDAASRFSAYVEGLASVIGHADRAKPLRDYCVGLMMPCERKSVEPMAAITAPERTAAKSLLTAPVHFGRLEGLRFEAPLLGFLPASCRAGWILSIPRNEQWMVRPYIRPTPPQPPRPGRTPLLPITLPGQHHRRVPGPPLPSERTSEMPAPQ